MAVDIVLLLVGKDFRRLLSFFPAQERQAWRNWTKPTKYVQDHIFLPMQSLLSGLTSTLAKVCCSYAGPVRLINQGLLGEGPC
jgi:hypothetical protein